jgi:hypothetical protein
MSANEGSNSPIPLSDARSRRRENTPIETSEQQLRAILAEVLEDAIAAKFTRLETSINRMVQQFESIHSGEQEDASLRVTTDSEAVDLASVEIDIPTEDYYKYTCTDLAEKLGIRRYDVTQRIHQLNLRENPLYHGKIRAGQKSSVNKWSEEALIKLRNLSNGMVASTLRLPVVCSSVQGV